MKQATQTKSPHSPRRSRSSGASWLIPALTSLAMLVSFVLAPYFPHLETSLKPYAKYNLSILLLLNAMHINYRALGHTLQYRPLLLGYAILVKNILLPLAAFVLAWFFWPTGLPVVILLTGISSGFSAPSFAVLLHLKPEINLVITMISSFLVPFSLPFLLHLLASSIAAIDPLVMMLQTAQMVFIPILCERLLYLLQRRFHSWVKAHSHLIIAMNMAITAFILMLSGAEILRGQVQNLGYMVLLTLAIVVLTYTLSLIFFCRSPLKTQMTMLIANLVSNSGLAAVLALNYLGPTALAIAIVFGIAWNFNIILLRIWPIWHYSLSYFLRRR